MSRRTALGGGVPWKPEELEHPPRLSFEVVHNGLVVHLQEMRGRQNFAPTRHQRLIGAMEAPELRLVVGEGLLVGKELGVAGEAGVHGVAPAVNDVRVRQDEPDHAAELEVRGHLVDHMPAARRHRRDMPEIGFPQRLQLRGEGSRAWLKRG